jgi:FkbM family methyltransferase
MLHALLGGRGWSGVVESHGVVLEVRLDDLIGRTLFLNRVWERKNTQALRRWLKAGATVFDVGANIGYFTLVFAQAVGDTGRVYSFEPEPRLYDRARKNVELNGWLRDRVVIRNVALSDTEGKALMDSSDISNEGHSHIVAAAQGDLRGLVEVSTTTGDSAWQMVGCPELALVKIDVEGHELHVLRGCQQLLSEASRDTLVVIECRDDCLRDAGSTVSSIYSLMKRFGFSAYRISANPNRWSLAAEGEEGELVAFLKERP